MTLSLTELNLRELPILARDDLSQLLGMVRRKDVIACYTQKLRAFSAYRR